MSSIFSNGITGKSSGRTMCVTPKVSQVTMSLFAIGLSPFIQPSNESGGASLVCGVYLPDLQSPVVSLHTREAKNQHAREELAVFVGRHPEVLGGEWPTPSDIRVGLGQERDKVARHDLVPDR